LRGKAQVAGAQRAFAADIRAGVPDRKSPTSLIMRVLFQDYGLAPLRRAALLARKLVRSSVQLAVLRQQQCLRTHLQATTFPLIDHRFSHSLGQRFTLPTIYTDQQNPLPRDSRLLSLDRPKRTTIKTIAQFGYYSCPIAEYCCSSRAIARTYDG
jgi:hypothetical protein